MVSITYDESGKSLYIDLERGLKISQTEPMGEGKYMDVSEDGKGNWSRNYIRKICPRRDIERYF